MPLYLPTESLVSSYKRLFCAKKDHQFLSYLPITCYRLIGQEGKVLAYGPGDLGSISGRIIPKTLKMVLDTSLHNTQKYKVRIISRTLVGGGLTPLQRCSRCILQPQPTGQNIRPLFKKYRGVIIGRWHYTCVCVCFFTFYFLSITISLSGGARGVMVIVAGYGHGDTSSNPRPDWLHFT